MIEHAALFRAMFVEHCEPSSDERVAVTAARRTSGVQVDAC